jgi:PAS domain S-box-containing protein
MLDGRYPRQYATVSVATLQEAKAVVSEQSFDAVLLDLSLPDSRGLETIGRLAAAAPNLPIVVLTGVADEAAALEAVRCGAQDYLLKGQADPTAVVRAIHYAIDRKRTEDALERERNLLRTLIDNLPDYIYIKDAQGRFLAANLATARLMGANTPNDLLGKTDSDFYPPERAAGYRADEEDIFRSGRPVISKDELHVDPTGNRTAVLSTKVPLKDNRGNIIGLVGISRNITRRKRMEERLARLNSLKEQLLGPSDLGEKLKLITDAVVDVFGADFARIWLLDEGDLCQKGCRHAAVTEGPDVCRDQSHCLHLVTSSGRYTAIDGGHRRVPVGCYKIGRIASGEEPTFVTNEVMRDPRVHDCQWAASLGLVSFAGYRLLSTNGTPLGVLALFSRREIDADEDALLKLLANTTAQVIRMGRAEESLRREKAFADIVIDSIPGVFYVLDSQGRFVRWNRLLEKVTGLSADVLRGSDALRTIFADDRELVAGKIREGFEKGLAETESRYLTTDGVRDYWFSGRRMDVGPTSYLVGSGIDITARKRAENDLKALNEALDQHVAKRTKALQMLHEIAVMVNQAQNAKQAMEYCLQRVVTYCGWSFGHVLLPAADKPDELVLAYGHYPEGPERFRRFSEVTLGIRFYRGQCLPGLVFISGEPEWTLDVRQELMECRAVVAEELGIVMALAFPVLVGQKVAAVLEFFADRVIQLDGSITDAMAGIGMQLGRVVERADFQEHLLTTAETIRRGIALDLHDDVGQELTGLGLKAETLVEMLAAAETPAGKLAADVAAAVDRTRSKVRRLSRGLLPVELEEGLLAGAIGQLVNSTTTGSRIVCKFDCPHPDPVFDGDVAVHLYRIAQEAVSNAVRHSRARYIGITLAQNNGETVLRIEDAGEGLGSEALQAGGMGLRTMRYRAELIGGKLEVGPGPSGGTLVVCRLPPRNTGIEM